MRPYRAPPRLLHIHMLAVATVACAAVAACSPLATRPQPLDARLASQNALFEQVYQADLVAHPELATSYGDYRYNDRLNDYSIAAIDSLHASDERFLARLKAISTAGFAQQDALSHQVLLHTLQQRGEDYRYREYEMPVSQMEGPHVHLADLPLAVPFDSVQALRGLHRAAASDPARIHPDRTGAARRHEGSSDAGALPAGESPGTVPGHHCGRSVPSALEQISRRHAAAGAAAPERRHHTGCDRRGTAGLPGICQFHRRAVRAPWAQHAGRHIVTRR